MGLDELFILLIEVYAEVLKLRAFCVNPSRLNKLFFESIASMYRIIFKKLSKRMKRYFFQSFQILYHNFLGIPSFSRNFFTPLCTPSRFRGASNESLPPSNLYPHREEFPSLTREAKSLSRSGVCNSVCWFTSRGIPDGFVRFLHCVTALYD